MIWAMAFCPEKHVLADSHDARKVIYPSMGPELVFNCLIACPGMCAPYLMYSESTAKK